MRRNLVDFTNYLVWWIKSKDWWKRKKKWAGSKNEEDIMSVINLTTRVVRINFVDTNRHTQITQTTSKWQAKENKRQNKWELTPWKKKGEGRCNHKRCTYQKRKVSGRRKIYICHSLSKKRAIIKIYMIKKQQPTNCSIPLSTT